MSSILFVTWDGGGNVAPALGIAAQLQHRGHHVRVLGYAQQRGAVESAGLRFEPYRHVRTWSATTPAAAPRWAFNFMATFTDRSAGRDLVDAVQREPVDAVVVDCMMLGALRPLEARPATRRPGARHVPVRHRAWRRGPLTPVAAMKGSPLPLWSAADRVLVTTLPELEPARPTGERASPGRSGRSVRPRPYARGCGTEVLVISARSTMADR
jgi:hypothetical protein